MATAVISLDLIEPPLLTVREALEGEAFDELVQSIREKGLLQPLVVTPIAKEALDWSSDDPRWKEAELGQWRERYRLQAGWRRFNACRRAGLREVECVVKATDTLGELDIMMQENLHRENPNPAAEGAIFAVYEENFHLNVTGIAERVGKSEGYVRDRLALVRGPVELREAVRAGEIGISVARELARCAHPLDRERLLRHAKSGGATAAMVRGWVVEAEQLRAYLPDPTSPTAAAVSEDAPPAITGKCDWCEQVVPYNTFLYPKTCPRCMADLQDAMRAAARIAAEGEAQAHGADHTARGETARGVPGTVRTAPWGGDGSV